MTVTRHMGRLAHLVRADLSACRDTSRSTLLELLDLIIAEAKNDWEAPTPDRVSPGTNAAVLEVTLGQLRAIVDHCDPPDNVFGGGGTVILGLPARTGEPLVIVPNGTVIGDPVALDIERESTALYAISGNARDRARDAVIEQGFALDDLGLGYVPPAYIVYEGFALYVENGDLMYVSVDTTDHHGGIAWAVARCVEDEFLNEVPMGIREALGTLRQAAWALVPRLESDMRPVVA